MHAIRVQALAVSTSRDVSKSGIPDHSLVLGVTVYRADHRLKHATVENFLREIASKKPIQFSAQQLARFTLTRGYSSRLGLGTGGFGTVYRGVLPNGLAVAVKVLHGGGGGRRSEEHFMAEVGTIGRTHHINLVRLFGFCFDGAEAALVYEYMERSELDAYLLGPGHGARLAALRGIAVDVARGIRYLHDECNDQQKRQRPSRR
ncbi:hypothetical protein ACP4OV_024240 [Aristida adscensionis]